MGESLWIGGSRAELRFVPQAAVSSAAHMEKQRHPTRLHASVEPQQQHFGHTLHSMTQTSPFSASCRTVQCVTSTADCSACTRLRNEPNA
eukprot:5299625-Amphidinium_carterae.1